MSLNDFPANLQPRLAPYAQRPASFETPAKKLTQKEALEMFLYFLIDKQLELAGTVDSFMTRVEKHLPIDKVELKPVIAGVEFWRAPMNTNKSSIEGASYGATLLPTMAFAVLLCRLATNLKSDWDATRIVWGGVGNSSNKAGKNCHDWGTCIDFYGAYTTDGNFDVRKQWSLSKIYDDDKVIKNRWAPNDVTRFRLKPTTPEYSFFFYVYAFATRECSDGNGTTPTNIGDVSNIIHPDYPVEHLREGHADHMHMQIGGTGSTT
jgi:hypothetical protein